MVRLGAKLSSINSEIFSWQHNSGLIGILACHVDGMIWGGAKYFKNNVTDNLKSTCKFGSEETETFVYIGIELTQNSDYSTCIKQTNYTASISEISRPNERMSDHKSQLTEVERTQYRGVVGHLNWVAGISRPDISFSVCGASSRCIYISTKLSGM